MEDDFNATPLSKLPPPMIQSRRPEPPMGGLGPVGPSSGGRSSGKDATAPSYAELLREMDVSAQVPAADAGPEHPQREYYDDRPADYYERPPMEVHEPAPRHASPPPPRPTAPARPPLLPPPPPTTAGGLVWRHRRTMLVALIVAVMLLYGVPKLQTSVPSLFGPMTMYKLNATGAMVVAASSAGIYATVSTYVL